MKGIEKYFNSHLSLQSNKEKDDCGCFGILILVESAVMSQLNYSDLVGLSRQERNMQGEPYLALEI